MHVNRYHWAISHYIGSQLRQCVLDPDGGTIYGHDHPRRLPTWFPARRLYPKPCAEQGTEGDASAKGRTAADGAAGGATADAPSGGAADEAGHVIEVSAAS